MVEEFAKFTPGARGALAFAQTEARDRGAGEIRGEHLLLGLLQAGAPGPRTASDWLVNQVFFHVGLHPGTVRSALEARLEPETDGGELHLSERAARALELAVAEARLAEESQIGAEHLLLALLQQEGTIACQVLNDLGLDLARARAASACLRAASRRRDGTVRGQRASIAAQLVARESWERDANVLGLEPELYERIVVVATRQRISVADLVKAFVELGLLTITAVGDEGGAVVVRRGGTEQELLKL